jgi:glutaconate CoA-transferase subunit A
MLSLQGSDISRDHPHIRPAPFSQGGSPHLLVSALRPDVAIIHVQRADTEGRAHLWGSFGICEEAALASNGVIYTAEEIVPPEVIRSDPNRVLAPSLKTLAVVHVPGGAHPSPVPGYYNRDHKAYAEYHQRSRTAEDFALWQQEWIDALPDRDAYLDHLGVERWSGLSIAEHRFAAPVDYGF